MRPGTTAPSGMPEYSSSTGERLWFNLACSLALLLFSRFLGLSWRRPAFGIALGLGILTSADLAMFALRAAFTTEAAVGFLNLLIPCTYLVCVSIWIGYLRAPELEPAASLAVVPHDEVETWNTELQHLLRD